MHDRIIKSKELVEDAIKELHNYQTGVYKPIRTRYDHLNYNLMGGLYPKEVIVIAGLSGSGKTYLAQLIEEDIFNTALNPNASNHRLVRCNWEMSVDSLLLRRLARETRLDIDEIRSRPFEGQCKDIASSIRKQESGANVYYMPEVATAQEFLEAMEEFLSRQEDGVHTVVSIDHVGLTKNTSTKKASIDDLVAAANILKKKYRVTIIIISQLNRSIEERSDNRTGHHPRSSDIYESSNMFQLSDATIIVHRPELIHIAENYMKFNPQSYKWLDKYKMQDGTGFQTKGLIFYHYIKLRNMRTREITKRLFVDVIQGFEGLYVDMKKADDYYNSPYKD